MFQEEKRSSQPILVSALVLVLLAAGGLFWFLKKYNHPDVTVAITQAQLMPLHVQYAHVFGSVGPDQTDDATYVLARVTIVNVSNATYFIKDLSATLTPHEGEPLTSSAFQKDDLPKLLAGFPQMQPIAAALGGRPLLRETTIAPHASVAGYVMLQFAVKPEVWTKRDDAIVHVDFYRNASYSAHFPKQ